MRDHDVRRSLLYPADAGPVATAPGRRNVANGLPASARAIARAVAAELRGDSGSALPSDLRSRFEQSLGADLVLIAHEIAHTVQQQSGGPAIARDLAPQGR